MGERVGGITRASLLVVKGLAKHEWPFPLRAKEDGAG